MTIKIAHLYYDLMNLYGEQGNIIALKEAFNKQNIDVKIDLLSKDDDIKFNKYDIFYIGTGDKDSLLVVLNDILKYKKDIKKAIDNDKYFIATGNSHELFGTSLVYDNVTYEGLGLFDYHSKENCKRIVGDMFVKYPSLDDMVIGFQNRSSIININKNHLFKVINGEADNYKSNYEGYHEKNFFGTYMIGPLLIRNPHFLNMIVKDILLKNNKTFNEDKDNMYYKAYNEYLKNFYVEK